MLRRRRSLLAQLRLGILPLHLERGCFRNKKKQVEDRICLICNLQYVENEEHFICVCTTSSHGLSNENKLVHLVKHKWREISIFIEKAWVKRKQKFYIMWVNLM